jgi:LysM repeat protein
MKVLRIFGIVAAVHLLAGLLIMANPGCSTKRVAPPAPSDTMPTASASDAAAPADLATAPLISPAPMSAAQAESTAITLDPALAASRYSPTRPGSTAATALQAEPVQDVTPASTVIAGKGDSLWSIAQKHKISVSDLAAANNLKAGASLRQGQKLIVPAKGSGKGEALPQAQAKAKASSSGTAAASSAVSTAAAPRGEAITHEVKPGETLGAIARKYGVKQGDIAVANNISDPARIPIGRKLTIPGWSSPKNKASTSDSQPKPQSSSPGTPSSPEPVKTLNLSSPQAGIPATDAPPPDLDAGLKQPASGKIPVIKIEETPGK